MSGELGALSLRIKDEGGKVVVDRVKEIDVAAKRAGASLTAAATGMSLFGTSAKAAVSETTKLSAAEKTLNKEIAEGTRLFSLQARTVDTTSKAAVQELRAAAAAQQDWLKQVKASPEQQSRFNLAVQNFEKRVNAAEVAQGKMVLRTRQQTAATQQLGSTLVKADGQLTTFSKSGLRALNGLAFAFSQMADQGEASLRSLAGQATSVLALLGKGGAIASIASTVGLAIFDIVQAEQKHAIAKAALDRSTAIKSALTVQKSFLDLEETNQRFAYERGLQSLKSFYDARSRIIKDRATAEITAKVAQAGSLDTEASQKEARVRILPDFLKGETRQQAEELRAQAKVLRAEAQAARDQGAAEETRNQQERLAAEKQLATQIRGFEAQRLEAQDKTHQARLAAIQFEGSEYRRMLEQQGTAEDERNAKVKAFTDAMTAQANLQQTQYNLSLLQSDLDTRRLAVQNDLAAGKITEEEASRRVADIETAMLPTLRDMVTQAMAFAAALGDEGALSALRALKEQLNGLGKDMDAIGFQKTIASALATGIAQGIEDGFAAGVAGGSFEKGFAAMGKAWLRGFGGLLTMIGTKGILANKLMIQLAAFLGTPAGLAASIGLVALGGIVSGLASSGGSGAGSGGSSSGSSTRSNLPPQQLYISSGGTRRSEAASSTLTARAAAPVAPVTINATLLNPNDPSSQRILAQAMRAGERRGL